MMHKKTKNVEWIFVKILANMKILRRKEKIFGKACIFRADLL